jgi:glycerate dehydrogenase
MTQPTVGGDVRISGWDETMARLVVLDGVTLNPGDNPWTPLEQLCDVDVYDRTEPEAIVSRSAGAEILVVNKVRLDRELLQQLPELKLVVVTATGHDCVDSRAARELGISVANVPVYGTESVAQHVFALLLHMIHRVDLHDAAIRSGEWSRRGDFSFWKSPLTELAGKTMGVVGFGRIGRQVGYLANAFGMRVLAHTRTQRDPPSYEHFAWSDLESLVHRADVVSLNCPLTEATRGLVNAELLKRFKSTAMLINASRGPLVVEADLADALNSRLLAAAAVDVVSVEPIRPENPLLKARNCFLTPHLAWATLEARQRLMRVAADNVAGFLQGKPLNVVN